MVGDGGPIVAVIMEGIAGDDGRVLDMRFSVIHLNFSYCLLLDIASRDIQYACLWHM